MFEISYKWNCQRVGPADDAGWPESRGQSHLPERHGSRPDWSWFQRAAGSPGGSWCKQSLHTHTHTQSHSASFWFLTSLAFVPDGVRFQSASTWLCPCWRRSSSWASCSSAWAERSAANQHARLSLASPAVTKWCTFFFTGGGEDQTDSQEVPAAGAT